MYKGTFGQAPYNICNKFIPIENPFNTRSINKNQLFVPYARTEMYKKSLEVMGPNLWNKLNVEITSSLTKGQFKYKYCKCYGKNKCN